MNLVTCYSQAISCGVVLGYMMVIVLAIGPKVRGFKAGRGR